jgi:hypothetical protein
MRSNRLLKKRNETSNFVIPANAGIQDVDETINFKSWTPAFTGNCSCVSSTSAIHGGRAGVTNPFFNSLPKQCARRCW